MLPLFGMDCLIRCTDSAMEPIMAQVPSGSGKIPHEGTAADRTVLGNNPMYVVQTEYHVRGQVCQGGQGGQDGQGRKKRFNGLGVF